MRQKWLGTLMALAFVFTLLLPPSSFFRSPNTRLLLPISDFLTATAARGKKLDRPLRTLRSLLNQLLRIINFRWLFVY